MPESKRRSKATYTPPAEKGSGIKAPSPRWWAPVMVTLMLIGLLWVVAFYLTAGQYPVPDIHYWNLGIGFGLMLVGFMMTTRWR
ncbi:cell division protein CrgA [uncultured Arsenicicoccus sp.]|uniref:cell division protein CrgA n=1 Tax=uncultured Arsenicicoccus sp. TaxID=491339 RepID=UPI002596437C|nr:cell division protein CrgA [uncultured Arsenicicoccus sp.]